MKVTSKQQMYDMYQRGLFGNKLKTWNNLHEFFQDSYTGKVSLRYAGRYGGAWKAFDVPHSDVASRVEKWTAEGAEISKIKINESAPDHKLILQGEVQNSCKYIDLIFSYKKDKMSKVFQDNKNLIHLCGVNAWMLLQRTMSPASFDDLRELLCIYPDSVIEFSIYEHDLGDAPHRNTLIWEVRDY